MNVVIGLFSLCGRGLGTSTSLGSLDQNVVPSSDVGSVRSDPPTPKPTLPSWLVTRDCGELRGASTLLSSFSKSTQNVMCAGFLRSFRACVSKLATNLTVGF